jgi:hypothetical protein
MQRKFELIKATPEEVEKMTGYRQNIWYAPIELRARPLDGIWATPPYLHNGSVPNMELLLSSKETRDAVARVSCVGSTVYDEINMGFSYALPAEPSKGDDSGCGHGSKIDTGVPGNTNTGHLFAGDVPKSGSLYAKGVIGPALSADDRKALIEFLKNFSTLEYVKRLCREGANHKNRTHCAEL